MIIDFSASGNARSYLGEGWSAQEPDGIWAIGRQSIIKFLVSKSSGNTSARITLYPNVHLSKVPTQRLIILLNGYLLLETSLHGGWATLDIAIRSDFLRWDGINEIEIQHQDAFSPSLLGLSDDRRELAFFISRVEFAGALGSQLLPPTDLQDGLVGAQPNVKGPPVCHIVTQGRLGNQLIQWFVALKLQSQVPGCLISNINFPIWNIEHKNIPSAGRVLHQTDEYLIEMQKATEALLCGEFDRVELSGFMQRIEYFLPAEHYKSLLGRPASDIPSFGRKYLLINVRGAEIVRPIAPHYTLVPTGFYHRLLDETGLHPIFMGQLEKNPYSDRLREEFPGATFISSKGADIDFEIIRSASNIVPSVSTFSWAAAWLSDAERIFFPVTGFYNPMQESRIDLLPVDDDRYRFYLFPVNYATEPTDIEETHNAIEPYIRAMPIDMIKNLKSARPRFKRKLDEYEVVFDETIYLQRHPEVQIALDRGFFADGWEHYIKVGFSLNLLPFDFDVRWYVKRYPIAAMEVAQGDFVDLPHHYVAVGRMRNYKATPF